MCGPLRMLPVSRIALARYAILPQRPFWVGSVPSITSASKPTPQATVKSRRLPPTVIRPTSMRRRRPVSAVRTASSARVRELQVPGQEVAGARRHDPERDPAAGERGRDLEDHAVAADADHQLGAALDRSGRFPAHLALSPDDLVVHAEAIGFEESPNLVDRHRRPGGPSERGRSRRHATVAGQPCSASVRAVKAALILRCRGAGSR